MIGVFDDIEARAELVCEPSRDLTQLPFEVCQSHVSGAEDECESFSISPNTLQRAYDGIPVVWPGLVCWSALSHVTVAAALGSQSTPSRS